MLDAKLRNLSVLEATGAVLIARVDEAEDAYQICRAAIDGGIRAVEVPLTVPRALWVIERLIDEYQDRGVVIGAGTVLDGHAAHAAISAGSQLLVSPHLNRDVVNVALHYQVVSMPGAMTPTEIVEAVSAGADVVKLFPAEILGAAYVRAVLAPLPQVRLAPTGGVSPGNLTDWFDAGVFAVGIGSYLTKAAQATKDYQRVTKAAENILEAISKARRVPDSRTSPKLRALTQPLTKE